MPPDDRLPVLDAVRGLAAAAVVLHHLLLAFWPYLAGVGTPPPGRAGLAHLLADSPASVVHDGSFAVVVFFVLSGFVLAHGFFRSPDVAALATAPVRRYVRLVGPILASVLLSFALIRLGLYRNAAAAAAGGSAWLAAGYGFTPHLLTGDFAAVPAALVGVFFNGRAAAYNSVLWSMAVELPGSLFVFALLALCGRLRNRWLIYAAAGWVLAGLDSLLFDFLLGVALSDWHVNGPRPDLRWSAPPLLAAAACLACRRGPLGTDPMPGLVWPQTAAAALVVVVPLLSPTLRRWGDARPLAFLGRTSFGLYLVHMAVIHGPASAAYLWLRRSMGHDAAAALAAAVAVPLSLAGGWVLYRVADRPSVRFGRWTADVLFAGPRPAGPSPMVLPMPSSREAA